MFHRASDAAPSFPSHFLRHLYGFIFIGQVEHDDAP